MTLFNDGCEVTLGILNIFHQSKFDKTPGFVTFSLHNNIENGSLTPVYQKSQPSKPYQTKLLL